MTLPRTNCRFLDLPAELRLNVYRHVLPYNHPVVLNYGPGNELRRYFAGMMSLLLLCKQVHLEVTAELYEKADFWMVLEREDNSGGAAPIKVAESIDIPRRTLERIRHLTLLMDLYISHDFQGNKPGPRLLREMSGLQSFRFVVGDRTILENNWPGIGQYGPENTHKDAWRDAAIYRLFNSEYDGHLRLALIREVDIILRMIPRGCIVEWTLGREVSNEHGIVARHIENVGRQLLVERQAREAKLG